MPKQVKEKSIMRENIFKENPFNPILKTHKLQGKYKDYLSFSVGNSYRIMFQFLNTARTKAVFINIGNHEIYK